MRLPEKKCTQCGGAINWKVVRSIWGSPEYNGLCEDCSALFRGREAPDVTKGKRMVKDGKIPRGIETMDPRITQHNADVQLGILRELQS